MRGTGRGGNNYSGAGILVELPFQGKVIDYITEDQQEYYGFDESDFSDPSPDGRVMLLLSYP